MNYAFDRYIATKYDLKEHTRVNYKYMYDRYVRGTFGKRIINDIKYSDVKFFYYSLLNEMGLQPNTLDNIHTVLHPTFQMAVRDDVDCQPFLGHILFGLFWSTLHWCFII